MNTVKVINDNYFKIIRVSKEGGPQKNFQEFIKCGLLNYPALGYQRWFWQYMENPSSLGQDPPAWVYVLDDKAVCHLGTIPVELKIGSSFIKAAWAVDFMTLPEHRRKGIGKLLVEEANKHFNLLMAVGGTSSSSFNFFVKMGWIFLGHVPYYVKILDLKTLLKVKIKNKFIAGSISMPLGLFLGIFNYIKRPRKPEDTEVNKINNFGEEADIFWKEISGYYKIIVSRNQDYLNWKYDRQPGMHYVKFRAVRKNRVCGYIIVRSIKKEIGEKEGLITDIIVRPDDKDTVNALLFAAFEYLEDEGCAFVRCYASHLDIKKIFLSCGLIRRNCPVPFFVNKNISDLEGFNILDSWFITAGDSDIDRQIS